MRHVPRYLMLASALAGGPGRGGLAGGAGMKTPLVLFLVAAVIPVFFGRIRSAPFWLTLQAVALGWNGAPSTAWSGSWAAWPVLRAALARSSCAVPSARASPRLMQSNLFTWAIAIALIVLAFEFEPGDERPHALTLAPSRHGRRRTAAVGQRPPTAAGGAVLRGERARPVRVLLPGWPLPVHGAGASTC
jgi:hypothetical protein